jgi:hypothetical protein
MSSNQLPSSPNGNRLYTRLITTLKILQFFGFFITVIFFIVIFSAYSQALIYSTPNIVNFFFLLPLIYIIITCIIVYILTAALIAIIDLLSRIEKNTRSEQ